MKKSYKLSQSNIPFSSPQKPITWIPRKLELVMDQLTNQGDNVKDLIEKRFPNAKYLDHGTNGIAYDLGNNRILKITVDYSEAIFASKFTNHNLKHVVQVYDIEFLGKANLQAYQYDKKNTHPFSLWGIIIEKVTPLTTEEEDYFSRYESIQKLHPDKFDARMHNEIVSLKNELSQHRLSSVDIVPYNLGWNSKGNLVVLDLGFMTDDTNKYAMTKTNWYQKYKLAANNVDYDFQGNEFIPTEIIPHYNPELGDERSQFAIGDFMNAPDMGKTMKEVIENRFPNAKMIGAGAYGIAYDIGNNKVLKLLNNRLEIITAAKLKTMNLERVVKIYDIINIGKQYRKDDEIVSLWGVITEKVKTLDEYDETLFDEIMNGSIEIVKDDLQIVEKLDSDMLTIDFYDLSDHHQHLVLETVSLLDFLMRHKITPIDLHSKNVGWNSNNKLVVLDLGSVTIW